MEGKNADIGHDVIQKPDCTLNDNRQSCHAPASSTSAIITKRTEGAYRAALERLVQGKATHPKYAGRPIKITPSAVAREANLSRNPLYTTHRALLSEIEAAAQRPTPASDLATTIARLEAKIAELHGDVRSLATEKQLLATENLSLLQRARQAEDRLASRDRETAELRGKSTRRLTVVK
jgi:chromosome segregation ATPase